MRKTTDREGFKTCPSCKLELAINVTNYCLHSKTKKPTSYCRKCCVQKQKLYCLTRPHAESTCNNCKKKFVYPVNDKKHKGIFCSPICFHNFHKKDDTERLEQRGLRDLNETHYQKDY